MLVAVEYFVWAIVFVWLMIIERRERESRAEHMV